MNIKQIKYFVSVAERGSLSAAAKDHDVTVQAMSKSMTDLEKDTAAPLFVRNHSGMRLTPFGEEFCRRARHVVRSFEELEAMADDPMPRLHASDLYSQLRIQVCAPSFSMNDEAKQRARTFIESFLGMETEVSLGTGQDGVRDLSAGDLDALITIGRFDHQDFDCLAVGSLAPCVCLSKNHPLARQDSVTLEELAPYSVIFSPAVDNFNESVLVTYQKKGISSSLAQGSAIGVAGLFYLKHAFVFMANAPVLGEMIPYSVTVPLAAKDAVPIPLCLVSLKNEKSEVIDKLERLLKSRPSA